MVLNGHQLIVFLLTIATSGVGLWAIAKVLKKLARGHLDEDIHKVVVVLAALASYLQYFDQIHTVLPPYIMGVSLASIYGVSQFVYKADRAITGYLSKVPAAANSATPDAAPAPVLPPAPTAADAEASF